MNKHERRYLRGVELRTEGDGLPTITGYAVVFNAMSEPIFGFREQVLPGACRTALDDPNLDVRALNNHDPSQLLGRYCPSKGVNTLRMMEDSKGLRIEITPPDTERARSLITAIQRGDLDGMSFAFEATQESWDFTGNGTPDQLPLRTVGAMNFWDVCLATYPAYPDSEAGLRSLYGGVPDIASPEFRSKYIPVPVVPLSVREKIVQLKGLTLKHSQV